MTKTVIFVGSTSRPVIEYFKKQKYIIGLFNEYLNPKNFWNESGSEMKSFFDFVIPLDFGNEKALINSLKNHYFTEKTILICSKDRFILSTAYLANILNLNQKVFLPIETVKNATSKLLQRKKFQDKYPEITPSFKRVSNFHTAYLFSRKHGFPLVVKPSSLSQSQLVNVCYNLEDLIKIVSYSLDHISEIYQRNRIYRKPALIIETFAEGKLYSVDSYVNDEGTVFHTKPCREFTGEELGKKTFDVPLSAYLEDFTKAEEELINITVSKAIEALKIKGNVVHTEVKIKEDKCQIIELNLRAGGFRSPLLKYSYGIDHDQNIINCILNKPITVDKKLSSYSAYIKLSPEQVGVLKKIDGLVEVEKLESYKRKHVYTQVGDLVGPQNHGFSFSVILLFANPDKAILMKDVEKAFEFVRFEISASKESQGEDEIKF